MKNPIRKSVAQQIVETVHDVCGKDVNFIDPKGIIFASTDTSRIGDYHEIGHRAAQSLETFEVAAEDNYNGTRAGINLPFSYNGDIIGVIGISGDPEEVRKYAHLAQRITRLILKEQELNVLTNNKKSMLHYCIHALVRGESISEEYLQNFLDTFEVDRNISYRCVLVQINERFSPKNIVMLEDKIYQAFEKTGSRLYTYDYSRSFILLLTEKQWAKNRASLEKLAEEYAEILKIGIGLSIDFSAVNKSFESARIALNSFRGDGAPVCFDNLSLEILLECVGEESREMFLKKTTKNLSDADINLLQTYFEDNCSLKATSEKLYLHKNTVQYKLDRIASETGYNPRKFQDAVILYLGIVLGRRT